MAHGESAINVSIFKNVFHISLPNHPSSYYSRDRLRQVCQRSLSRANSLNQLHIFHLYSQVFRLLKGPCLTTASVSLRPPYDQNHATFLRHWNKSHGEQLARSRWPITDNIGQLVASGWWRAVGEWSATGLPVSWEVVDAAAANSFWPIFLKMVGGWLTITRKVVINWS